MLGNVKIQPLIKKLTPFSGNSHSHLFQKKNKKKYDLSKHALAKQTLSSTHFISSRLLQESLQLKSLKIIPKFVPNHSSFMVCSWEGVLEAGEWRLETCASFSIPVLSGKRSQEPTLRKWAWVWIPANSSCLWSPGLVSSTPRKLRATLGRNHLIA